MTNITLKQLRYFEALAEKQHFGHAAAVCAISQPALSVQIKEMESDLGQPLFERGARQVRLTHFGEGFAEHARDILSRVDALADYARTASDQLAGLFGMRRNGAGACLVVAQVIDCMSREEGVTNE